MAPTGVLPGGCGFVERDGPLLVIGFLRLVTVTPGSRARCPAAVHETRQAQGAPGSRPMPESAAIPSSPSIRGPPKMPRSAYGRVGFRWPGRKVLLSVPFQCAVQPPSTGRATPVMELAASPHRNTTVAAISSTVAKRFVGCSARKTLRMTSSRLMPCALA